MKTEKDAGAHNTIIPIVFGVEARKLILSFKSLVIPTIRVYKRSKDNSELDEFVTNM